MIKAEEGNRATGLRLKNLRHRLGLSIRDVAAASRCVAEKAGDDRYLLSPSQVADMENHGRVPGIHKLCALAIVYERPLLEVLSLLGVDVHKETAGRTGPVGDGVPDRTRPVDLVNSRREMDVPLRFDPMFSRQATVLLNRVIVEWRTLPFEFLNRLDFERYLYVRIGRKDNLMHPLLRAGSVVKVDTRRRDTSSADRPGTPARGGRARKARNTAGAAAPPPAGREGPGPGGAREGVGWRNEHERPLFLVETPRGWRCAWCLLDGPWVCLVPHPLSLKPQERYRLRSEAEIVGTVVGGWVSFSPEDDS
ncbi:MAG: helix-turn-helix transcriptional regulator [Acidobacteria bacterium]|nr:helix-turn-helix transcriptional regulator [Acidobacteriota bacterium]